MTPLRAPRQVSAPVPGPVRFARYASPPNRLGLCGPDDHRAFAEHLAAGRDSRGLRALARAFEGAWPYLELIAAANRLPDPLDPVVVEAYWVGNPALGRVPAAALGASVEDRFRRITGARDWERIAATFESGPVPHHDFHVFAVTPWTGLLRSGAARHALHVLDRCRIRWGTVVALSGERAVVRTRPLRWDGRALSLAAPALEEVFVADDGTRLVEVRPGDTVALHWDWVCERLTPLQAQRLRTVHERTLATVNRRAAGGRVSLLDG